MTDTKDDDDCDCFDDCSVGQCGALTMSAVFFASTAYGFTVDFSYIGQTQSLLGTLEGFDGVIVRGQWLEYVLIGLLVLQVLAASAMVFWAGRNNEDASMFEAFYCCAPFCSTCTGKEQYLEAIDKLRMQHPIAFRPTKDIATAVRFMFNTCIIVVVQAIVLSAVVGMVGEAIANGSTDQSAEDLLGTSAVLFVLSLASALYSAMSYTATIIASITGTVVQADEQNASALKKTVGNEWIPPRRVVLGMDIGGKHFASKSRVQLRSPICLLPIGAGLAAGGALMLTVAVGASYYDVAIAFEDEGLTPADLINGGNDDAGGGGGSGRRLQWDGDSSVVDMEGVHGWLGGGIGRMLQDSNGTGNETGNETGNGTRLISRLDGEAAVILRDLFLVRLGAVFLSLGWIFMLGLGALVTGLAVSCNFCIHGLGLAEDESKPESSDDGDDNFGVACCALMGTFAILLMMFTAFAYLMIGLAGAGIIGGSAWTLWYARSFYEAAIRTANGEGDDDEIDCSCGLGEQLVILGVSCCMPRIESRKVIEEGATSSDVKTIRRLHAPLRVARWVFRGAAISALSDFVLGIVALSNPTIYRALDTELVEGYEIGIVCGILGVVLCGVALIPLGWVLYSGVLGMTEEDDGSKIQEQLEMSYCPAVLSLAQAAAFRHDDNVLIALKGDTMKELDKMEKDDDGVGMIPEDADDIIEMPDPRK